MTTSPPLRPAPLRGAEIGSFAHYSITVRWKRVGQGVLDENDFPPEVVARLEALVDGLPEAPIRFLEDPGAPDVDAWNSYIAPYAGLDWLQPPWFFGETYFYRRVLEATGYFQPGPRQGLDPYIVQKQASLDLTPAAVRATWTRTEELLAGPDGTRRAIAHLLMASLWANQVDLSMWPAGQEDLPDTFDLEQQRRQVLADDTAEVLRYLFNQDEAGQVDFILDNTGPELGADLCLSACLLSTGLAESVVLHVKAHPTFVSDVIKQDVSQTLDVIAAAWPGGQALSRNLQEYLAAGRLRIQAHLFWTSPLPLWEMPPDLRHDLGQARLLIIKGDANYRRSLGDSHWAFDTPIPSIWTYLPAPMVGLRVLKSEVAAGLPADRIAAISKEEPKWMVNGRWGVIQFHDGPLQRQPNSGIL